MKLDKNIQVSLSKKQWESVQYYLKAVDCVRFSGFDEIIDEIVTQAQLVEYAVREGEQ